MHVSNGELADPGLKCRASIRRYRLDNNYYYVLSCPFQLMVVGLICSYLQKQWILAYKTKLHNVISTVTMITVLNNCLLIQCVKQEHKMGVKRKLKG